MINFIVSLPAYNMTLLSSPSPPNTFHHLLVTIEQPSIHPNMSQDYLTSLLNTPEHRVQGECAICLEPFNTMNTTTGIIEVEIRLGCRHTFGSACIVTWLRDNNSCPLCRTTFFPAQPRPYLEHGIMDTGRESTGRINATGSITSEPNAVRSVTVPASSELEPRADSRTRIFEATTERRVNLPTGPEVPRSSTVGRSGVGRSNTCQQNESLETSASCGVKPPALLSRWPKN